MKRPRIPNSGEQMRCLRTVRHSHDPLFVLDIGIVDIMVAMYVGMLFMLAVAHLSEHTGYL